MKGPEVRLAVADDLSTLAAWEAENTSGATWTIKDLSEEFVHRFSTILVAEEDGELTGYLALRRRPDSYQLLNILVPTEKRRRGVARQLMGALNRLTAERPVHLEVRASNEAALQLYRACAYEQVGLREGYYRDGEDAVLMTRD